MIPSLRSPHRRRLSWVFPRGQDRPGRPSPRCRSGSASVSGSSGPVPRTCPPRRRRSRRSGRSASAACPCGLPPRREGHAIEDVPPRALGWAPPSSGHSLLATRRRPPRLLGQALLGGRCADLGSGSAYAWGSTIAGMSSADRGSSVRPGAVRACAVKSSRQRTTWRISHALFLSGPRPAVVRRRRLWRALPPRNGGDLGRVPSGVGIPGQPSAPDLMKVSKSLRR